MDLEQCLEKIYSFNAYIRKEKKNYNQWPEFITLGIRKEEIKPNVNRRKA